MTKAEVIAEVASAMSTTPEGLRSGKKKRDHDARKMAVAVLIEECELRIGEAGDAVGLRPRTSENNYIQHKYLYGTYRGYRDQYNEIKQNIASKMAQTD